MVLVHKWPFFRLFFLGNIDQKKLFSNFLDPKNAFLGYKNKKSKKSKNWNFSPWFWFKNGHFSNFLFLGNIGQENVFYDIRERKNAFLRYKNKKFKKSKNWHFSKGVNPWFWAKNGHFCTSFFEAIKAWKMSFLICWKKKTFLGYKNKKSKNSKNWHFSKAVNPCFWSENGHISNFFF